jgi:hypothetical protein
MKIYKVLSEIKTWSSKHLNKLENHTNALLVNLLHNSETTHTEEIHRPNSPRQTRA